jgi:glutamate/tyrosine decarboxylase-like PLP-dependent enzyme
MPDWLRSHLMTAPLPHQPSEPAALLERIAEQVLPYPMGNNSPRFFGWVNSPPAPIGVLAELVAAFHNASVAGGDHAATYIEHGVLGWFKSLLGYPAEAGGLLVSGGSMANLIPLGAMRHWATGGDVRQHGLSGMQPMVVYTSEQGHSCIQKAVELLGFGSNHLRKVPVDAAYRMDVAALRAAIAADRAAGLHPVCVVASAGTVNTGAIDPLAAIADLCQHEHLWLHVDGAYGAFGLLAPDTAPLFAGIERADSIACDPHKWLYVPIECGCALVRDAALLRAAYSVTPAYLRDDAALPWFSEYGVQQTRGFRALKLWLTLQSVGLDGYRDLITRDLALAALLREKIAARPPFTLVAGGPLSITCFRYAPVGLGEAQTDALNRDALARVQAGGRAFLTGTELGGRFALRACIVNFRTMPEDLDALLDAIEAAAC